ncbi:MAG: hypothetical protein C4K47_01035, partial [Candidatus Thorarchaeota archaeon]
FGGARSAGRSRISSFRSAMKEKAKSAPVSAQAAFKKADKALAGEEETIARQEEQMRQAPAGAPSAAADQAVTENLRQMKRASRELFGEEEKE